MVPTFTRLGLPVRTLKAFLKAWLVVGPFLLITTSELLAQESIVERERARRSSEAHSAAEDLKQGDAAYRMGDYAAAVIAFGSAREKLSQGPATAALKSAAIERLGQASVERARDLSRLGRRDEANALLDAILDPEVAPDYAPALAMQEKLNDPIRTNPSLDAETVKKIDEVRRLLYEAEGFASLAQFDRAQMMFNAVLRIDPHNSAARRGMERINASKSHHYQAAADERRSRMFAQIDEGWQGAVKPVYNPTLLQNPEAPGGVLRASAREKLKTIMFPTVDLEGVDIFEAVEYLRQRAEELDVGVLDNSGRGVGIVVDLGTGESEIARKISGIRFNLKLNNVPLGKVLEYITKATGTQTRIDEYAVVIRPSGTSSDDLLIRTFQVPPEFLSREAVNQQSADANPFDDDAKRSSGLLGTKLTAREYLEKQGVFFPEGANATYRQAAGALVVRNTETNLDFVEQIVAALNEKEPVVVLVDVTFVSVSEERLEELGYDVLLTPIGLSDETFIGGGTTGNGTPIRDFGLVGQGGVTSGNRSGDRTRPTNTVDAAINRDRTASGEGPGGGQSVGDARAPGILAVTGFFTDGTVSAIMRGLQNNTGADFMIQKSVATRSGQVATVESTREMIYPTEYDPPEVSNSFATPANPTAFDVRKVGCDFEVEPLVGPNRRYIELAVKPSLVEFDGFINYGSPILGGPDSPGEVSANAILMPVFSKTEVNTNVTLADGATMVIGGLLKNSRLKFEDSVPILGKIPLMGRFFRSESETNTRTALLVFVKVRLVDPAGQPFRDDR